jgi:hypothetical protein
MKMGKYLEINIHHCKIERNSGYSEPGRGRDGAKFL